MGLAPLAATLVASLVFGGLAAGQPAPPADRIPTFRTEVNYVEVDAAVFDAHGAFVGDLRREDFELLEDGVPHDVATFSLVTLPIPAPPSPALSAPPVEPDVRTNGEAAVERVFVVLLDDLHTSAVRTARVKALARQFIQGLGPNDLVSVIHASGRAGASQEFTQSRSRLLASVDRFSGSRLRSATLERLDEHRRERGTQTRADIRMRQVADPLDAERARRAESLLGTVQGVGEQLADARGRRKSLVLIGEGLDYEIENAVAQTVSGISTFTAPEAAAVLGRVRDAVGAMARANVAIYAIDPAGLATAGDTGIEAGAFPDSPLLGLSPTSFQDEVRRSQDSLRVLSEQTGGVAAVGSNDFAKAFERIVRDSSRYYMIGYYSRNTRRDGRFRRIEVRVKRPDVEVHARKGYVASPSAEKGAERKTAAGSGKTPARLRAVLDAALPVSGVPLRAYGAAFKGAGKNGSLFFALEAEARAFTFGEEGGLRTGKVEAAVLAVDNQGKVVQGDDYTVALRLTPGSHRAVRDHGLRLLFRLDLPPGRYQIRAAVRQGGASGSVHYDAEIPDFDKDALALSGLVLSSSGAAATPTPRTDPDLEAMLQGPPTGLRNFTPSDILAVTFALYHRANRGAEALDVVTTVEGADGGVRFRNEMHVSPDDFRASPGGFAYLVKVPLKDLGTGPFVLKVTVKAPRTPERTLVRELPFTIPSPGTASAEPLK